MPARRGQKLAQADWAAEPGLWKGRIFGRDLGTEVSVLFYTTETVGEGPKWHVHPYDEIFILTEGRALFTVGDDRIEAQAGDFLLGPAGVPHKYHNLGPGRLSSTDIHLSPEWIQTDLDDPDLAN